jgi:hypothetical protein
MYNLYKYLEVRSEGEFILDDAEVSSNVPVRPNASANTLTWFLCRYIAYSGASIP